MKCRAPGCDPPLSPPHSSNPMGLERGLKNASFLSTSSPGVILHTDAPGPLLWDVSSSCPGKSVTNAQGYPLTGRQRMNEQMSSFLLKGLRWGGVSHKTLTGEKKPRQRQAIQMWFLCFCLCSPFPRLSPGGSLLPGICSLVESISSC